MNHGILGESQRAYATRWKEPEGVADTATTDIPVSGGVGCPGKERFAQMLHAWQRAKRCAMFYALSCAAIPGHL